MSRYKNFRVLNNSNEYYRKLRQKRNNTKNIVQYETPILTLWWIIAWYNARPTEADILPGDLILIPLSVEDVLDNFGI